MDDFRPHIEKLRALIEPMPDNNACLWSSLALRFDVADGCARASLADDTVKGCLRCDDQQWEIVTTDYRSAAVPCPGMRRSQRVTLYNAARIPARYVTAFLPDHKAQSWAGFKPGDQGWWLHGASGVGKSKRLAAILRHLTLGLGLRCSFVSLPQLRASIRHSYNDKKAKTEHKLLAELTHYDVLALDDLQGSRHEWTILEALLDRLSATTLLITSAQSPDRLSAGSSLPTVGFRVLRILREQVKAHMLSPRCGAPLPFEGTCQESPHQPNQTAPTPQFSTKAAVPGSKE